MKFDLIRPCADCPFRRDTRFGFPPARAEQMVGDVIERDLTFPCHKTTMGPGRKRRDQWQMCGGALILHEKLGRPNWRLRFAHRLGLYDPAKLRLDAPVVDTMAEFMRIQTR